ncbi:lipase 2 [Echria macrotheca]|uniref:Lipase 2 n=1 Tax=Echria macrotheca TaxID=438768 RepID=A0AAJ0F7M0_9PEZI|nr:lipase 2 [Echria macrotheca]
MVGYLPPPTYDAWYAAPSGWESAVPGTVLKVRPHAYPTINIRNCNDTFQVLYRSSDTHGQPSWAVTTVFIPVSHARCDPSNPLATNCSHAIVSYQVPMDSVSVNAQPSYLLQAREPYGEMRDLLARGWFVAVPDYEGPNAAYCAGKQAAYATLDGARAVLAAAGQFRFQTKQARIGLWGYSGGAFATAFALEMAASYAPDLKIAGGAVGGPAPNLTTVARLMNNRDTAGLVVASVMGVTVQFPQARQWLVSRLKADGPYNATAFMSVTKMSGVDALVAFSNQNVYDYFDNGEHDVWHPIVQDVIDQDAVMGVHGSPAADVPVFVYKAVADEMSLVGETDALVKRYCDKGSNVLYHRNTVGGHNDELWSGRLRTMDFLADVLETDESRKKMVSGVNVTMPASGCLTQNVSVPLDVLNLLPDWWWTGVP